MILTYISKTVSFQGLEYLAPLFNKLIAGSNGNNFMDAYIALISSSNVAITADAILRLITFPLLCPNYAARFTLDSNRDGLIQIFTVNTYLQLFSLIFLRNC